MNTEKSTYDLKERTAKFGEEILQFVKTVSSNTITRPLISQLVRSATSIGANYREADNAESKKDFIHKISICRKEADETRHWLRMIATAVSEKKEQVQKHATEAKELHLIFNAIVFSSRKKLAA